MRVVKYDFQAAAHWASTLLQSPLSPEAGFLVVQTAQAARLNVSPAAGGAEPAPLGTWLDLEPAGLLEQVRLTLGQPVPEVLDPLWDVVVPGCAFAACRENDLPLAAALLELLLHWNSEFAHEIADFLAFQQRADGACGFLNPLKPAPFAREQAALSFHLPATHAVTRALAVYELRRQAADAHA